ncbi:AMP-binding protein [Hyphobacterium marinum]|uniref:AMP-binding protein n=1 Tax=Hyphobacterium marinum TaxID=3116574 RepID=A0ABU7LYJ5_9PROT|nr:AMP-binding protein [Hyphobacterium sp. Y6023]MEE2566617.1 AMP-binding protein [Hyphobacterium sp. Y6023]
MTLEPSGYADSFARDRLPAPERWPEFRFDLPELAYPKRLNCAAELLDTAVADGHGDTVAIYSKDRTLTYAQLLAEANRIANVLTGELGMKTGERVLLHGPNCPDLFIAWYGVIKAGGIVVATMPLLRARELVTVCQKAEVSLALCDMRMADEVRAAADSAPFPARVVEWGQESELENLTAHASPHFDNVDTAADDIALLAFTSGTTGQPKACVHFHRSVLAMADTFGKHTLKPQPGDIYAGTPPLAFTFGLGAFLVFPARARISVALTSKPGFEALCETIQEYGVTHTFTAPTGYRAIMGLWDQYDLSSLKGGVSAGEHLPKATWQAYRDKTGIGLVDGIGATEMIHIFISASGDDIRPGATGKAVPGYEARVIGPDGKDVPDGEIGRLAVRGPTGCLYLDDNRQDVYVQDGWNITGDLYRRDADGYFHFVARNDDLIVSSGYNIAGPEVEQALLMHGAVAECAVIGAPCADRGMIVQAHIVLKPGHEPDEELAKDLQNFVKATIAPYKYPRSIVFTDALPKTQTGKIQRFKLREAHS